MNTFKRKSLYAALAGVSALGGGGAADAGTLDPCGPGQVRVYPCYRTRANAGGNAYWSLWSVVNTPSSAKAVKVRFLEGKNSREVLDFNLFLSKHDVWTAAILPGTDGGAFVGTLDKSCTLPPIPAGGQPFVNFAYTGSTDDQGGPSLECRLARHSPMNGDLRGLIRGRVADNAQYRAEFIGPDGRTTNTSGGGLLTLGMTFYF